VLWYGGRQAATGHLPLGTLVAFSAYLVLLAIPLQSVSSLSGMFQHAMVGARRVFEILDATPAITDLPDAVALPSTPAGARLVFDAVAFSYPAEDGRPPRPVLAGLALDIAPGERVAVVGDTGSGKSSLAALAIRAYDSESGRVVVDGHDVTTLRLASLRAAVAIVSAEPVLFTGTLWDNVSLGTPQAGEAEIRSALWAAAALDFAEALPDGLHTIIGERGQTLSGGQRQRVALARALLRRPRAVILDDALSQLDAATEDTVLSRLPLALDRATVLCLGTRPPRAGFADRVMTLADGRIADGGGARAHARDPGPALTSVPIGGGGDAR
jgi:ATP-binding cassette subfamily B protein